MFKCLIILDMYLRRHSKKINGEEYGYWSLVESVRTARGPRQRVVASGNKWLRWALVEAAQRAPMFDMWLREFYNRISKKGSNIARVAVARRLMEIIYQIWTQQRPYYTKPVTVAL